MRLGFIVLVVLLAAAAVSAFALLRGGQGAGPSIQSVSLSSSQCGDASCVLFVQASVPSSLGEAGPGAFSNVIEVTNPTSSPHTVNTLNVFGVQGIGGGSAWLEFFYYTSLSQFNPDGTPAQTPVGSCQVATYSGCTVFVGAQPLPPGGRQFLVVLAHAQPGSDFPPSTFSVSVKWS